MPILVTSESVVASDPIIGYNVIEAIVNRKEGKTEGSRKQLEHKVSKVSCLILILYFQPSEALDVFNRRTKTMYNA